MTYSFHHLNQGRQRGIAIVEFAIGVILLIVLMMVTAEIGRALYSYNTLTKSVRIGARHFSTVATNIYDEVDLGPDPKHLAYVDETKNMVVTGEGGNNGTPVLENFTTATVVVSEVDPSPSGVEDPYIKVAATYTFVPIFAPTPKLTIAPGAFNFAFTMQAASTMRVQK